MIGLQYRDARRRKSCNGTIGIPRVIKLSDHPPDDPAAGAPGMATGAVGPGEGTVPGNATGALPRGAADDSPTGA